MRALLTSAYDDNGVRPRVVQSMSQAPAILSLVSAGLGLTIVPEEMRNACFDNVVFRPIKLGAAGSIGLSRVASDLAERQPQLRPAAAP